MREEESKLNSQNKVAPFPWDDVIAFGFVVLKFSSAEFWAMTPREISYAMKGFLPHGDSAMTRTAFRDLMQLFPDDEVLP